MVYTIKIFENGKKLSGVIIWANIEVDVAIACGQYNVSHESRNQDQRPTTNTATFSTVACLPSLRPIVSMVAARLATWRKPKNQHKKGTAFLMDMLAPRYRLKHPWAHNRSHMLDPRSSVPPATYDPSPRDLEAV